MRQKVFGAAIVVIGLVLMAITAQADRAGMKGDRWEDAERGPGMHYYYAPDLTEEQRAQMIKLRSDFLNDTAAIRGQMVTKKTQLKALRANPDSTPEEIAAKQMEILKTKTEFSEKRIAHQAKMRGVLTKEQLKQMSDKGYGWGQRRGKHQRWGCDGGPGQGAGPGPGYKPNCPRR
jgi:Spy/CpxP family protein refolding chaperone